VLSPLWDRWKETQALAAQLNKDNKEAHLNKEKAKKAINAEKVAKEALENLKKQETLNKHKEEKYNAILADLQKSNEKMKKQMQQVSSVYYHNPQLKRSGPDFTIGINLVTGAVDASCNVM